MPRPFIWSMALIAILSIPVHAQNKYVGVQACAPCHGRNEEGGAFHLWQTSRHAGAYRTLMTHSEDKARKLQDLELWIVEIGRGVKYGLPRPAVESKECLPCHMTAFGVEAQSLAPTFDPRDGVQCESCHGPGSAHAQTMAMKGRERPADGLKRFENERAIKAQCMTCHEGTCGDFDFAQMWPEIKHSPPISGPPEGDGKP